MDALRAQEAAVPAAPAAVEPAKQAADEAAEAYSAAEAKRIESEAEAAAAELAAYWQEHAVTHGDVATGGGRELLRYAPTARLLVPMLVGVPGC